MGVKRGLFVCAALVLSTALATIALGANGGGGPGGGGGGGGPGAGGGGFGGGGGGPGGGGPGGPGGRRGGRGGAPNSLGAAMTDMNAMVTKLKDEASDPTKADQTLKDIAQFERDVAIAKTMPVPAVDATVDAAKSATDFRNNMNTLIRTALDLEDAVINKKADQITKDLQTFADTEKAGHGEFRKSN